MKEGLSISPDAAGIKTPEGWPIEKQLPTNRHINLVTAEGNGRLDRQLDLISKQLPAWAPSLDEISMDI